MLPKNALDHYGGALETYHGSGELTVSSGRSFGCEFVAGQLETGKTLVLCATRSISPELMLGIPASNVRFNGRTDEGYALRTDMVLFETSYLPETSSAGTYLALQVGHLSVYRREPASRRRMTFLLVNLDGDWFETQFSLDRLRLTLKPIPSSRSNLSRLQVVRSVLPTAQLQLVTRSSSDRVIKAIDRVCYLLSVALGTKIQWVRFTEASQAGRLFTRHHYSRVTKRYGTLRVIGGDDHCVGAFLKKLAEKRRLGARKKCRLSDATIDTYVDAKAEGDFLQVRALKLVVAVEMMKAEFSDRTGRSSFVLPWDEFLGKTSELKKALKSVFSESRPEQRNSLYAKLRELNRTSFSSEMQALCTAYRVPLSPEEVARFVASRNKLVHEGRFYCERATDEERQRLPPLAGVVHEWFWLLHFVDRLVLRAIGYEGPYLDWSLPNTPTSRELWAAG